MPSPIDFYFDFSSPYSYFASFMVDLLADQHGRSCVWKPILLGPAFKASGNLPLAEQPLKGDYARHDWERIARLMGVPYRLPEPFPVSTLTAARAFWCLEEADSGAARAFAEAVFAAYFAAGRDISRPEVVGAVAGEMGIDAEALLAAAATDRAKARARAETDDAIARGVFGAPFLFVDGEPFWGGDRLWMVHQWLERGGW
ncbi:2-hydroxychromene-2-carboxylate isomerase [Magnetospirillum sp. UT-4]|uniref:2-hydroxychromene-2-carboxylate isomerase n=1 Tax=Magnetospirillum sp. UT-4 TaxID=2681467 RepID=UPI0013817F6A|nr:2-hydroxychromene-2-carboxylate isomerase [Magnetospirillum sp. UT-4]CAA7618575.1 2-hydroxychromene-2-carboxylate isomerase [Magnetospirillum sp. UT-4]